MRAGVVESVHRGDIVEADAAGRVLRLVGDPERLVNLRSAVKPFGLLALLGAGGEAELDLTSEEIAIMASSHSGEDVHVRTIQAMYRRLGVPQSALACGSEGMPLDPLTASRLARDGERPGPLRHMCSGQHSVFILLAKLGGWDLGTYWEADHPAHRAYRSAVAAAYNVPSDQLRTGIDSCGVLTYAFPLHEVARAFAILADPDALPAGDPRTALAGHFVTVRDAMLRNADLVGGTHDRLDTSLMKALPGRIVSKNGREALQAMAILPGKRSSGLIHAATGMAVKIEDGSGYERGTWAATVEALRQAGALDGQALRMLGRYHRPSTVDSHGRTVAEAVADFDLAPMGELLG